jgi:flagellar hook protein FlgE
MASYSIPLTGFEADSTALNTIANDLSNMNTTAFKAQTTNFSDLFYQEIGSTGAGNPIQVGAGVKVASNETSFTQGSINSTGNATDVALNGNGFFVIGNGSGGYELTRDGNFTQAANGDLMSNGMSVMGYPAVNGVVNTNAPLTAINVPIGAVQESKATTTMSMTANLDSATTAGTQFPAQLTVYDSLGEPHVVTATYTPTANANVWDYSVALPASDYSTAGDNTVPAAITGTMQFDSSGNLTTITPTGGGARAMSLRLP